MNCFAGIDIGSTSIKIVLIDGEENILGQAIAPTGSNFHRNTHEVFERLLTGLGLDRQAVRYAVSTGYGRKNVSYTAESKTEIGCHAKGCFFYFPFAATIIDIGGQDNKIIKLDNRGLRTNFKMNRKCAAGTGAFLEEMAMRLDVSIEEMDALARRSENMVKLGSFCTVFSATEVLENIRQGKNLPDIVKGVFYSMVQRVLEMDTLTEKVVMTGGVVAHNPYLIKMTEEIIGRKILVPDYPQLTGAIGAALYAMEV